MSTPDASALFLAIAAAHLLGIATPGPDWAIVLRQSISHGRRDAILTAAGIASGIVAHTAWAFFALVQVRDWLPLLLPVMQAGAVIILLALGLAALRADTTSRTEQNLSRAQHAARPFSSFGLGLATNLLNAKAALFFLGLGAGLATVETSLLLRLGLASWLVLASFAFFCVLGSIASAPGIRTRLTQHQALINRLMGLALIGIAILIAFNALSA